MASKRSVLHPGKGGQLPNLIQLLHSQLSVLSMNHIILLPPSKSSITEMVYVWSQVQGCPCENAWPKSGNI